MNSMYIEFANKVKGKLIEELNGYVRYELYPNIDTVIFKICFKDFDFAYALNHVSDSIYNGVTVDSIVDDFKRHYLKEIKNSFFKSEERKKRDKEKEYRRYENVS